MRWSGPVDTLYFDTLKLAYHLGLAVIVGGALGVGWAAAPAIFRVTHDRAQAANVFSAVLERFDGAALLALMVVAITTILRAGAVQEDPRDLRIVARWVALALMGVAVLYGSAWADPVARSIRKQTPGFDDLPDNDIRRREFRTLHERSRRALSFAMAFGAIAVFLS